MTPKPDDWICADCGHEQPQFGNCEKCGSVRTAIRWVIEKHLGPDWKEKAFGAGPAK